MNGRGLMVTGAALIVTLALLATAAPWVAPYDPQAIDLAADLEGPGATHWLGCDELGRDILSRLIWGARASLTVGVVSIGVSLILGLLIGGVAGYAGGAIDAVLMRVVDVLLSFPGILLAIAITGVLGPSFFNVILALTVLGWVTFARLVRGQVLSLKERDFVTAARALGASPTRVLIRHILPEVVAPVTVQATFGIAGVILAESSLSFLGLGPQDVPTWGAMLSEGVQFLLFAPHLATWPGLAVLVTVLAFNLLGDGLRDYFDVKGG
ncbi:MAG: ABC transporter permease [Deltaproteobacteria bacterium]|nr:ABC transporter permease [Deltaproteobacteria bacterium]MCB9478392.1 ABC transporter permease [Deltaproteobacteria bacterium]